VASRYIETVPRRGYKFVADVRKLRDEPHGKRRRLVVVIGTSAIALLSLAVWRWPSQTVPPWPLRMEPLTSYAGSEMKPSFSPDGSQVAFSWSGEQQDNYDIYVKVLNAGPPLRLTRDPAPDIAPAWSPDGRQIAFVRNRAVFLIPALGGSEQRLAEVDAGHLAWTPDARAIAANSNRHGIVLISSETGDIRPLTAPPASAVMGDLVFAFSPTAKLWHLPGSQQPRLPTFTSFRIRSHPHTRVSASFQSWAGNLRPGMDGRCP
jgi:dipeptidyl aminopeptidase/acylaminoacyl peptidase